MKKIIVVIWALVFAAAVFVPVYAGSGPDRKVHRETLAAVEQNFAGQYVYHPKCSYGDCKFKYAIVQTKNGQVYRFGLLQGGHFGSFSVCWHAWDMCDGDYGYSLVIVPRCKDCIKVYVR